jgi:hypothetical protein
MPISRRKRRNTPNPRRGLRSLATSVTSALSGWSREAFRLKRV